MKQQRKDSLLTFNVCRIVSAALIICVSLLFLIAPINAMSKEKKDETVIKAALIYNISRFVQWSKTALPEGSPFIICVVGRTAVGDALNAYVNKNIKKHPIKIKHDISLGETSNCNTIFIPYSKRFDLEEVLSHASEGVLTVSDIPEFEDKGGMVALIKIRNKIRFSVNLVHTNKNKLKVSSKLLRLALKIVEE